MRYSSVFVAAILAGLPLTGSQAQQRLALSVEPGKTPGVVADEFPPGPNESDITATIRARSEFGVTGRVSMRATCCWDVIRGRQLNLNHLLSASFWGYELGVRQTKEFPLSIRPGGSSNRPGLPYGKYLVRVTADAPGDERQRIAEVGLTILPELASFRKRCTIDPQDTNARVSVFFADVSTDVVIRARISEAERTPPTGPKPPFSIAMFVPARPIGIRMDVSDTQFAEDSALVVIAPTPTLGRGVRVGCVPPSARRTRQAPPGAGDRMVIRKSTDPTIVLRMQDCNGWRFFGDCLGEMEWIDIFVFAEEGFWDAFGGKTLTFTWFLPEGYCRAFGC